MKYKTIDIKFHELCQEIDYWKDRAEHFESLYKEELQRSSEIINEQLESSKKGVANALMLALSVTDNPDGSIFISKEDRERLAKNYH